MAINNGEVAIIVLLGDEAAWVLAEGADLIFEWSDIADELSLIEVLV